MGDSAAVLSRTPSRSLPPPGSSWFGLTCKSWYHCERWASLGDTGKKKKKSNYPSSTARLLISGSESLNKPRWLEKNGLKVYVDPKLVTRVSAALNTLMFLFDFFSLSTHFNE